MLLLLFSFLLISCEKKLKKDDQNGNPDTSLLVKIIDIKPPNINKAKNTVRERFDAPKNYEWIKTDANSYGNFLETYPLQKYGSPVLKFNNEKINNQHLHEAVFNIDVGARDLQQCADAIIRLRAEYLYKQNKFDKIAFHFTSGDLFKWNDYKNGIRPIVSGNKVSFRKMATKDISHKSFRNYLDLIFTYAGTISVFKETNDVLKSEDLQTGDFMITPGSPGHVVFIAGVSKNKKGEKLYLLGEGFTPAQSISVIKNPYNPQISPWYELKAEHGQIKTSRYSFSPVQFKRYD